MQTHVAGSHVWRFFRAGGFDQVKIETGADLANLDQLDQKLWVALACPTAGLEFDAKTLALIDTDQDGRIRATELLAAVRWACSMLKNPDDLVKGGEVLPFAAINDATPEGRQLLASAKQIAANLGRKEATGISLADASDTGKIFVNTTFNGDGVIIPESAGDEVGMLVIQDLAACMGTVSDRSGKPGIDQAKADAFFAACAAYEAWVEKAEAGRALILPAGDDTAAAAAAVKAVKAKVDDFFGRVRLAAFDPRTVALLNRREEEYLAAAAGDLSITAAEVANFPIALVAPGKALPLKTGINPAHAAAVAALDAAAVKPLLGDRTELTEADWAALQAKLGAYEAWTAEKTGAAVEKLGVKRIREILASTARDAVSALIARDKALEPEATSISAVEQLARYHRDLFRLCNNFVSFRDFYGRKDKAIFQAGTLYLDQRSCDLCLLVEDAGKHAGMAALAGTYLAYCDCVRKGSGEKTQIVAAFTNGDSDNLMIGRNGIFYDRKGRDWDATITKILDNPISIRQAFWAPYKKCLRMIEEQIAKRASAAGDAAAAKMQVAAVTGQPPPPPPPKKVDPGMLAAIGLVLSTLLVALGGIFAAFVKLPVWQMPLAVAGILLAVSIPSMIIAWLKLRKRNLGPILDANGWAVNTKAKVNVPFGASLTKIAVLPAGAQRNLVDPFAEKKNPWPAIVIGLLILAAAGWFLNQKGLIYKWTGVGKEVVAAPRDTQGGVDVPKAPAAPADAKVVPAEAKK